MAHGFKYIPKRRTASPPQPSRCSFCGARTDIGMAPHICKEITWGTPVMPTRPLPLAGEDEQP